MPEPTVRFFYDELIREKFAGEGTYDGTLGETYDEARRGAYDGMRSRAYDIRACACGIGTQALGLALRGHRVTGTDLSPAAAARVRGEAAGRGLTVPTAAADMRELPFLDGAFDVVVCTDNSLPHLLRPHGLLLVSTRAYDAMLRERPLATPPAVSARPEGRVASFSCGTGTRAASATTSILPAASHRPAWAAVRAPPRVTGHDN
ncbi:class I SAM-dependent methyltransferase [Streptomyces sp. T-3]|nr:class I SAM-dependent methyltransferase [Streptomyces sp. T-3]